MGNILHISNKVRSHRHTENAFAEGTVYDADEREYDVTVYGQINSEPRVTNILPEDCTEGYFDHYITRVIVHTTGGGHYEKCFDSFDAVARKDIERLFREDNMPTEIGDCDD